MQTHASNPKERFVIVTKKNIENKTENRKVFVDSKNDVRTSG